MTPSESGDTPGRLVADFPDLAESDVLCSLSAGIDESVRKGRPWYSSSFEGSTRDKSSQYIKEIQAIAMVVRCFEVGGAYPTEMCMDQSKAFPTDLYAAPVDLPNDDEK